MTPDQISLIKSTWEKVVPISQTAGELFYDRLYELDPALDTLLFTSDHVDQIKKLMSVLDRIINNLDEPEAVIPLLQELGKKNIGYGVIESDYVNATQALLWTLEHGLGDSFTTEVQAAWFEVFELIASVMGHDVSSHH